MLERWGHWVFRWRWITLALSAVLLAVSLAAIARGGRLTTGTITGTESDRGRRALERELPATAAAQFTMMATSDAPTVVTPEFRQAFESVLAPLRRDPRVISIRTPFDSPVALDPSLVSRDGHAALAVISLRDPLKTAASYYPEVRARLHSDRLQLTFTGALPFTHDLDQILAADVKRAELVSIPFALIILVLVFGALLASAIPIAVGGLSVVGGVAGVLVLSHYTDVAQYSINIVTLVGLGVAIDYSLFIVRRFQENLARGLDVEASVAHAVGTAGRAVAFSGLAVMVGMSGLLFYRGSYLTSVGLGGGMVVGLALLYALTFLPALLGVLGPRVNWGRIPTRNRGQREGLWHRIATWVMRRPVLVLIPTLALMLFVGAPFLRIQLASPTTNALPTHAESRRGQDALQTRFPERARAPIAVVVLFGNGPVLAPGRAGLLHDFAQRLAALPDASAVESAFDIDPRLGREAYEQMALGGVERMPPEMQGAFRQLVGARATLFSVRPQADNTLAEDRALVTAIRQIRTIGDGEILVTGQTAVDLDAREFIVARTPRAIGFVMLATYLTLLLLLGSFLLPLKAVVMNLLSIAGSFGALVWIFQEGHLSGLLGFTPAPIDPSLPVILFCTVFGLSMDYEVLLLSRIQEEYLRCGDNTRAVAEGLERSGRLIMSAAVIMIAVFAAFALAEVVLIKAIGLGMAIAVALDATIVRVLIVPATMRLFGDLNWWGPRSLQKLRAPIEDEALE